MNFFKEYAPIIGLLVLTFVIVMLFSNQSMLFSKSATAIDTELAHASGDAMTVRTRMDLGSDDCMNKFPIEMGHWRGSDYNTANRAAGLSADVMLMRAYTNPESYQPLFFLIIQSDNRSSFHPPIVCYPSLGYTIEEEGKEKIPVSMQNVGWEEEFSIYKKSEEENKSISVKKLVVVKESNGKITERRVVLYLYLNRGFTSNTITMIRVSALAPLSGSYENVLEMEKEFLSEAFPHMFEFRKEEKLIIYQLMDFGLWGWLLVIVLFMIPILIICYPRFAKG
ncbi:MAG: exosortase-associated EpsI family protein [Euryarchaeota archaeon]|nr:exosortase-associated EpsI family protein [Euryarchaeota archaeon]